MRTTTFVVIAADGKPTYRGVPGPATVCKIYQTDQTYFAIEGLEHDSARAFFPKDVIAHSFAPSDAQSNLARLEGVKQSTSRRFGQDEGGR